MERIAELLPAGQRGFYASPETPEDAATAAAEPERTPSPTEA
jgi:hypothetical protein